MNADKGLSIEGVIETLTAALVERYGTDALAVALRQAELAIGLPRETWEAIVVRLRASDEIGSPGRAGGG